MAKTIDWLKRKMAEHGIKPAEVARIIGSSRQTVNKILHQGRRVTADELLKLQQHIRAIEGGVSVNTYLPSGRESGGTMTKLPAVNYIKVIGEVAAGAWKDVTLADFEEYTIPIAHDPRWPKDALKALVVRGESINRQARDGDLVLTLAIHEAPRDFREDDWVIVERQEHGKVETTVKRVGLEAGKWVLLPDSTHPAHQEPIHTDDGDPGITVRVTAFVLDFVRQATKL